MKTHAKHVALGGILAPIILAIAAAIANGAQQALNLNLHGTALAIFVVGFVAGATLVTNASVKAEAAKVVAGGGLGDLMDIASSIFGGGDPSPPAASTSAATTPLPPPPPAPKLPGGEN